MKEIKSLEEQPCLILKRHLWHSIFLQLLMGNLRMHYLHYFLILFKRKVAHLIILVLVTQMKTMAEYLITHWVIGKRVLEEAPWLTIFIRSTPQTTPFSKTWSSDDFKWDVLHSSKRDCAVCQSNFLTYYLQSDCCSFKLSCFVNSR